MLLLSVGVGKRFQSAGCLLYVLESDQTSCPSAPEPGPTGEGPGFRRHRRTESETLLGVWSWNLDSESGIGNPGSWTSRQVDKGSGSSGQEPSTLFTNN
jgi:hypothetical protein